MTDRVFDASSRRIRETLSVQIVPLPRERDGWTVWAGIDEDGAEFRHIQGPFPVVAHCTPQTRYSFDRATERRFMTLPNGRERSSFSVDWEPFPLGNAEEALDYTTTFYLALIPPADLEGLDSDGWIPARELAWSLEQAEALADAMIAVARSDRDRETRRRMEASA